MMNANNPQTPGVYTVEKNAFPNAVAEVPTAIPAFIGYTEIALKDGKPITNKPLLINSFAEYTQHFGGAPVNQYPITLVTVPTPGIGQPKIIPPYDVEIFDKYYKVQQPVGGNNFYLYNCLQLFYQNGGGPCYIVSVGPYKVETTTTDSNGNKVPTTMSNVPDKEHFLTGLAELPKIQFPKPTMILTPDALNCSSADYYTVQEQVLLQCGELGDRVGLIDVYNGYMSEENGGVISNLRNSIGNNYLEFGISYYPFLETTIVDVNNITYANIDQTSTDVGPDQNLTAAKLSAIFPGNKVLADNGEMANITADYTVVENLAQTPPFDFSTTLNSSFPTSDSPTGSESTYNSWNQAFNAFASSDNPVQILQWQLRVILAMAWEINYLGQNKKLDALNIKAIKDLNLQASITKLTGPNSNAVSLLNQLAAYDYFFRLSTSPTGSNTSNGLGVFTVSSLKAKILFTPSPTTSPFVTPTTSPYPNAATSGQTPTKYTLGQIFDQANAFIKNSFKTMLRTLNLVEQNAMALLKQYNASLVSTNADYKKLMAAVAKAASILPPCSAMAGVMTLVDETEGVWHAPANRNIESVIAPTVHINNDQQATMNVDVLAGKSINAIRSFYGQGPAIIWGARTLDGNSLDWKYVSVRRTMIMIEQSVKDACFGLVFQPNDASTWTLAESMIANFLHNLWSEGCLQGTAPTSAYSVSCGIGKTMTPQDLLAGIMRVEVKVALVRPAEFIIITYEQEMATS